MISSTLLAMALMTASITQPLTGPVSPDVVASSYLSELRDQSRAKHYNFLVSASWSHARDTETELYISDHMNKTVESGQRSIPAIDVVEEMDIRCSSYACEVTYLPDPDMNLFAEKREIVSIIQSTPGLDLLEVMPNAAHPANRSLIHIFILRESFVELISDVNGKERRNEIR